VEFNRSKNIGNTPQAATPSPPTHTNMNHHIKPLAPTRARLVMESDDPYFAWKKLTIVRFYFHAPGKALPAIGAVLGRDPGMTSALVLNVHQRDLVVVYSRVRRGSRACTFRYFRITDDWKLLQLEPDIVRLKTEGLERLIEVTDLLPDRQIDSSFETLRDFLAESHPAWLEAILTRQVAHWRLFKQDQFLRLAPTRATDAEFAACIRNYPLTALANFKARLTKKQLRSCIRRSLLGGVTYAFDELSPTQIAKAEVQYPAEMILYAAKRLTDEQLRRVAAEAPCTAFKCHPWMPPARQALVLSISYGYCHLLDHSIPRLQLNEEIIRSITHHPAPWLHQHGNDFAALVLGLWHHLELTIPPARLLEMLLEMPEQHREPLLRYLAGRI